MILITGGSGYLGGRLAEFLSTSQVKPVVLATKNKNYYLPEQLNHCKIAYLDVTNIKSIRNALKNVTDVIHLAALNAEQSLADPEKAKRVNVQGTLNLLENSKGTTVKRFIYISTAHIYGAPLAGFIDESTIPKPSHPYATTHYYAEQNVLSVNEDEKISGTVLRLSNAVGAPIVKDVNCWMLVINDLIRQIIQTNAMCFKSSRTVKRNFISINEVCRAVDFILNSKLEKLKGIYNLGSDTSISLGDLAYIIAQRASIKLGIKPEISFHDNSVKLSNELFYSTKKIQSEGFRIDNDLEFEIDNLLKYCKKWFA